MARLSTTSKVAAAAGLASLAVLAGLGLLTGGGSPASIRTFFTDYPDAAVRDIGELHALFAAGRVSPHIGARFPLAEAGAGQAAVFLMLLLHISGLISFKVPFAAGFFL